MSAPRRPETSNPAMFRSIPEAGTSADPEAPAVPAATEAAEDHISVSMAIPYADRRLAPPRRPQVVVVNRRPQPGGTARVLASRVREQALGIRRFDLTLLGAALALSVLGGLLVWSATVGKLEASGDDPKFFLTRHLINLSVGATIAFGITRLDYWTIRSRMPLIYALVVLGLVVVLTPFGSAINGTQAWLSLPGGFTLQPGEIAKLAVILVMANVLADRDVGSERPTDHEVRTALWLAAIPLALIMLQPDLGTVLVILSVVLGVLVAAGVRLAWVVGLAVAGLLGAVVVIGLGLLDRYQLDRLLTFVDPNHDPLGIGYNTAQARIAIGAGGFFGSGLFQGHQTQGAFVPYQQTDFIFSVAGEELGFAGAGSIIILLAVVVWRGCVIARQSRDRFGRVVAAGVVLWFAFQAFENIGMNLGIMPVTGVPLPFVSYGGTSMFAAWAGIGLLQRVYVRSRT